MLEFLKLYQFGYARVVVRITLMGLQLFLVKPAALLVSGVGHMATWPHGHTNHKPATPTIEDCAVPLPPFETENKPRQVENSLRKQH